MGRLLTLTPFIGFCAFLGVCLKLWSIGNNG